MCFKPPSPPKPTAEQLAREEEQKLMLENQKADAAAKLAADKQQRTQSAYSQQSGAYGTRSLISGPKGGMGYLS